MPFCKMCFDSGRSGFDNHNVKDSSGNITCTYLLNIKCHNCGNFGHTPKYCKVKTSPTIKSVTFSSTCKPPVKTSTTDSFNQFTLLCENQNDDREVFDLPPVSDIIWGVGFASSNNNLWANVCDCSA